MIEVELEDASALQVLRFLATSIIQMSADIQELKEAMADLIQSVADLQAAVAGVADRVSNQVAPLQAALAQAQQALTDFQAADATEDASYQASIDQLTTQLQAAVDSASTAGDAIEASVSQLNGIAQGQAPTDPEAPVEPTV